MGAGRSRRTKEKLSSRERGRSSRPSLRAIEIANRRSCSYRLCRHYRLPFLSSIEGKWENLSFGKGTAKFSSDTKAVDNISIFFLLQNCFPELPLYNHNNNPIALTCNSIFLIISKTNIQTNIFLN